MTVREFRSYRKAFRLLEKACPMIGRRRGKLIDKLVTGTITKDEKTELDGLELITDAVMIPSLDREIETLQRHIRRLEKLPNKT